MENDSLSHGLYFYIESPEYRIYNRIINTQKKYSAADRNFYNQYCTVVKPDELFPANLATGWFFNDSCFSAELDLSKSKVRSWSIKNILNFIQEIKKRNSSFKFAGLAWDVPQLSGDFWSTNQKRGGRQVNLSFWSEDLANNYKKGRREYYRELFKEMRNAYPNAKVIMEPSNIYNDWLKDLKKEDVNIMPDILSQESKTLDFLTDKRIIESDLIRKDQFSFSCPSLGLMDENLLIAGQLAVKGIWFNWFGRFGGTGTMPNYKNVWEVPSFFRLIRAFTNWENLNKTSLSKRKFENGVYTSPTAFFSKDILWGVRPDTKNVYCVFLTTQGFVPLKGNLLKVHIYQTDSLMGKKQEITKMFMFTQDKVRITNKNLLGKTFIIDFI